MHTLRQRGPIIRDTEGASEAADRRMLSGWARIQGYGRDELRARLDLTSKSDRLGRSVLARAALAGDVDGMVLVIEGSDIEARDFYGATPLILVARSNSAPAVRTLLAAGADPSATDDFGWTALMHASDEGDFHSVQALARCCDAKAVNAEGETALMLAAHRRGPRAADIVGVLLPLSDAEARDHRGDTALDRARAAGNPATIAAFEKRRLEVAANAIRARNYAPSDERNG